MKLFLLRKVCFLSACIFLVVGTLQAFENLDVAEDAVSGIGWYNGTEWVSFEVASISEQKAAVEQTASMVAAIQSNGTGGGSWNQTSTWAGGVIPTAADVVTIDSGDVVTGAALNEFTTLQIEATATLNLHGGTLSGAGAVTNDGTIAITLNGANGNLTFDCDVTNNGTINWSGLNLTSTIGSAWTNNGIINLQSHQSISNITFSNENGASFNKPGGNTITTVVQNFTNKAGGTISVSEGLSLTFQGDFANAGTIDAAGTLIFNDINGTFTGGTIGGTGFLNIQGTDTITATSGVTFSVDTIEHSGAIIGTAGSSMTIAAASTWRMIVSTRLSMETVTNNGKIDLYITNFNNDRRFDGDLINHGTIEWTNGGLSTTDGAIWTNHGTMNTSIHATVSGIEFINENGGNFNRLVGGSSLPLVIPTSFTNKSGATITVSEGATLTLEGVFTNAGTIDAVGTLEFNNINGTFTGGTIGGTGFLNIKGTDTITATSGVTFSVDTIEHSGAIIGTAGSSMTIAAASTWRMIVSTRLSMETVTNNGKIDLYITNFNSDRRFDGDLINHGTIEWTNGGLSTTDGAIWTNHGTMNTSIHSTVSGIEFINENGGNFNRLIGGSSLPLVIPTSLTNKAGGTLTVAEGATLTLNGNLSNAGTIDAAGTLNLTNVNCTFTGGTVGGTGFLNFTGIDTITATSGVTIGVDTIGHSGTIVGTTGSAMTIGASSTWRMLTNAKLAISTVNDGKLDLYIARFAQIFD